MKNQAINERRKEIIADSSKIFFTRHQPSPINDNRGIYAEQRIYTAVLDSRIQHRQKTTAQHRSEMEETKTQCHDGHRRRLQEL